jgi:putative transposase
MANTYTQIHIQAVFAVKYRAAVIARAWKDELHKYITGIIQSYDHKVLAVGGIEDHVHLFFGMRPTQSLSDLMQNVKGSSATWVNQKGLTERNFRWQGGFSAFSYRKKDVPVITNYVLNQENHHRKTKFLQEYKTMLNEFEIPHEEAYIFRPLAE